MTPSRTHVGRWNFLSTIVSNQVSSTWEYENDRVDHYLPPLVRSAASRSKYLVGGVFLFEDNNEERTVLLMNLHKDI